MLRSGSWRPSIRGAVMVGIGKAKITNWQYVCLTCGQKTRPLKKRENAEALALLHKLLKHSHRVMLVGLAGTSPVEEVSGIAERA